MDSDNCAKLAEEIEDWKRKFQTLMTSYNELRTENRIQQQELDKLKMSEPEVPKKERKITRKIPNRTKPTNFPCDKCTATTYLENQGQLKVHPTRVHGTSFQCTESGCTKSFGLSTSLRNHRNVDHGIPDPYKCEVKDCGKEFGTYNTYSKHRTVNHSKPNVCEQCQRSFTDKVILNQHLSSGTCGKTEEEKKAMRATKTLAAVAFGGIKKESEILKWFEEKLLNVILTPAGGIMRSRIHKKSGIMINGSCDGTRKV